MPYFSLDDIAQIAAPPGEAAVGALRVSGSNTFAILAKATRGIEPFLQAPERTVRTGELLIPLSTFADCAKQADGADGMDGAGRGCARQIVPCPARFFLMPAPASYTREHSAEIHLPASRAILHAALAALVAAGARAAAPGEFTFRAFRNGRITLGQAEAVEDVVKSETAAERRQALSRLRDGSGSRLSAWRDKLLDIAANIETALDFSEEETDAGLAHELAQVARELDAAGIAVAERGGAAPGNKTLPHIALAGLANAGKSSLMNALLGEAAVLVSPEASTTRDSLRREVRWHGAKFILSDNPGYQDEEHAEGQGDAGAAAARRAFGRAGGEDAVCWVIDAARPVDAATKRFADSLSGKVIIVLNKADLPAQVTPEAATALAGSNDRNGAGGIDVVAVVRTGSFADSGDSGGSGVEELRSVLAKTANSLSARATWNARETHELSAARECCRRATAELSGPARLELAAEDVRRGLAAFSRAMGEGYAEETLGRIFSQFCIGK